MAAALAGPVCPDVPRVPLPTAPPGAACSAPPIPDGPRPVCPRLAPEFEPWRQAGYWKAMHDRAVQRAALPEHEVEQLRARLRLRGQQPFGRKTEAGAATATATTTTRPTAPPRRRGQQPGRRGPRRRDHAHLPAALEGHETPAGRCRRRRGGRPFAAVGGTEDSAIPEVEAKAHRRLVRRHRYRPACDGGAHPGVVTAPPAPRLTPESIPGASAWVTTPLDEYLFHRPTYRLLADLQAQGLGLSPGTVAGGLQRLLPLFEPVCEALAAHSRRQPLWHGDETRWLVFATVEGEVGFRWHPWVAHAAEVVVFIPARGRSHGVPEGYLGPGAAGVMVVDRYKAYQAMGQVKRGLIVLAFCRAHVRRDFLTAARARPGQDGWALGWVGRVGAAYRLDDGRLAVRADAAAFAAADARLREAVTALGAQGEAESAAAELRPARRKVLGSLGNHWTGLAVFVGHPEVPMDDNTAERPERGPVVGRKNYCGSGAVWAGRLAAMLFSLFQTLCLWELSPRAWLTA
jgi:transposase